MTGIGRWPCPHCATFVWRSGMNCATNCTEHTAVDTASDGQTVIRCEQCKAERRVGIIVLPDDMRGEAALGALPR